MRCGRRRRPAARVTRVDEVGVMSSLDTATPIRSRPTPVIQAEPRTGASRSPSHISDGRFRLRAREPCSPAYLFESRPARHSRRVVPQGLDRDRPADSTSTTRLILHHTTRAFLRQTSRGAPSRRQQASLSRLNTCSSVREARVTEEETPVLIIGCRLVGNAMPARRTTGGLRPRDGLHRHRARPAPPRCRPLRSGPFTPRTARC